VRGDALSIALARIEELEQEILRSCAVLPQGATRSRLLERVPGRRVPTPRDVLCDRPHVQLTEQEIDMRIHLSYVKSSLNRRVKHEGRD